MSFLGVLRTGERLRTPCLSYEPFILWSWNVAYILAHIRGTKWWKKIFPKWVILFPDVTTNSECRSVFQKMPIIFQNNFKRVTKSSLLLCFNFQNAHFIIFHNLLNKCHFNSSGKSFCYFIYMSFLQNKF